MVFVKVGGWGVVLGTEGDLEAVFCEGGCWVV